MNKDWPIIEAVNHIKKKTSSRFEETVSISIVLHDSFKANHNMVYTSKLLGSYQPSQLAVVHIQPEPSLTQRHKHAVLNINVARKAGIYVVENRYFQPRDIITRKLQVLLIPNSLKTTLNYSGLEPTKIIVAKDSIKSSLGLINRKASFHASKTGSINVSIGKLSFPFFILSENITRIVREVLKLKPTNVSTNSYLKKVVLSSTMNEGMRICLCLCSLKHL
ncbi:hypothetical protein [Candidatus Tremblaya phenacola]|uniref:Large ribosomal subunit protein uL1 n=1 Tax=Candidatus Tremblayella phenacoccinincola TaxID=1010676 RepID=A0A2G0V6X6_9PROT|nr:hypothetical protein [Candidatus Tremblaya phenacola]PHN16225.1 50S ribosomal protein L1 [Candidatus Tremblaya phenacola]